MESKLLSPAVGDSPAETVRPEPPSSTEAEALADVRKAIVTDSRKAPADYLAEIRVAASGE
jgi:hypothetical protein